MATGESIVGVARDISVGGMFVESEVAPAFGVQLTIVVTLPGTAGQFKLPAVVRWAKPGGFGIQFGLLGARETHALTNLLKHR
jgi:hypothetical protein